MGSKPHQRILGSFFLLATLLLTACGQEARPTPDYSTVLTPVEIKPTSTPPFQAVPNSTPEPSPTPTLFTLPSIAGGGNSLQPSSTQETTQDVPTVTPTAAPDTPVVKPTPTARREGVLTSDDLGISSWSDTEILWSPRGDIFLMHVLKEGSDGDFYYLIRPPDSIQSSFKLPRSVFSTMAWSPDGRYVSYIEKQNDNAGGPVKFVDTQRDFTLNRPLFGGPCTTANWLSSDKLIATCGLAVYGLNTDLAATAQPDAPALIYKLENNRFSGLEAELAVLLNALPSPDSQTLALFALRRQKSTIPIGEIAFYNLATKKLSILARNDRPVTMIDWTPDSKNLILRNIVAEWSVPLTFDFYLADRATLKISQNLTKSNDKCDPVLGAKIDCQGIIPSTIQSNRIMFSPDSTRYLFSSLRYISRPNAPLSTAERLSSNKVVNGKVEQMVETAAGERIVGLTWLPKGHYFYSVGLGVAAARPVLDGKPLELRGSRPLTPQATSKPLSAPTKASVGGGSLLGFSQEISPTETVSFLPPITTLPPTPTFVPLTPPLASTVGIEPTLTPTVGIITPTLTLAPIITPTLAPPTFTPTFEPTVTPLVSGPTKSPTPQPRATVVSTITPATPTNGYPRSAAYYISPTGSWLVSIERVGSADRVIQFQVRLLPFSVE